MSLTAVRAAMMDVFSTISGVVVPDDPLPMQIEDKTIIVFPRTEESAAFSRGGTPGSLAVTTDDSMQVEYHRRVPYQQLGSVFGDVTAMIDTIVDTTWGEEAGGKFGGTVFSISRVALMHFGAIGWNEWTFGARLEIGFTHLRSITP